MWLSIDHKRHYSPFWYGEYFVCSFEKMCLSNKMDQIHCYNEISIQQHHHSDLFFGILVNFFQPHSFSVRKCVWIMKMTTEPSIFDQFDQNKLTVRSCSFSGLQNSFLSILIEPATDADSRFMNCIISKTLFR